MCHCADCQALSGSAFRTVIFVPENQFKILSGQAKAYVKTAESGNRREQTFCPECGSPLYSAPVGKQPRSVGIRLGTARQRDQFIPKKQYWTRSAQSWVTDLDSIEVVSKHWSLGPLFAS